VRLQFRGGPRGGHPERLFLTFTTFSASIFSGPNCVFCPGLRVARIGWFENDYTTSHIQSMLIGSPQSLTYKACLSACQSSRTKHAYQSLTYKACLSAHHKASRTKHAYRPSTMNKRSNTRYSGDPCVNGCGDIRYRRNGMCVTCRSTRTFGKSAIIKNNTASTYIGRACASCGGKVRYLSNRVCVSCIKLYSTSYSTSKRLERLYGLTATERAVLLKSQNGRCAICERLSVDHDPDTKIVRGLLCYNCNRALGYFGDHIEDIEKVLTYLRKSQR
jgi:hypothetical protein